jgi:hypothetical protein
MKQYITPHDLHPKQKEFLQFLYDHLKTSALSSEHNTLIKTSLEVKFYLEIDKPALNALLRTYGGVYSKWKKNEIYSNT